MPIPRLSIFCAGDDTGARDFADGIAGDASRFARTFVFDVDWLNRATVRQQKSAMRPAMSPWPLGSLRIPVYVISHGMTAGANAPNLACQARKFRDTGTVAFYICFGLTRSEVLARLGREGPFDVLVAEESDRGDLVRAIQSALTNKTFTYPTSIRRFAIAAIATTIGPIYSLSLVLAFGVLVALIAFASQSQVVLGYSALIGSLLAFGLGVHLATVPPLDLWPFLGTAVIDHDAYRECEAVVEWRRRVSYARARTLAGVALFSLSLWLIWTALDVKGQACAAVAIAAGLFCPYPLFRGFLSARRAHLNPSALCASGLEAEAAQFPGQQLSPAGRKMVGSVTWGIPRISVFISYPWPSAETALCYEAAEIAARLERTLTGGGVQVFLDRHRTSPFREWRAPLVEWLLNCTHHFVVLAPSLVRKEFVIPEILTSAQRWYFEPSPAIILVGSEQNRTELAAEFCGVNGIPTLGFLKRCPLLSSEDARDYRLLVSLMLATRRQRALRDWATMIVPGIVEKVLLGRNPAPRILAESLFLSWFQRELEGKKRHLGPDE